MQDISLYHKVSKELNDEVKAAIQEQSQNQP